MLKAMCEQGTMVISVQGPDNGDPNCVFPDMDGNTNDGYAACLVSPLSLSPLSLTVRDSVRKRYFRRWVAQI